MKTFMEWVSDYQQPINHNLTHTSSYEDFLKVIQKAIKYVNTHMEDDRVEFPVFQTQVKVWRTRINGEQRFHVGWKHEWEEQYHETTPDQLAYFLYNYWNASGQKVKEPKGGWYHGNPSHPSDVKRRRVDDLQRLNREKINRPAAPQ